VLKSLKKKSPNLKLKKNPKKRKKKKLRLN
jgi:hypothetical protein